MRLPRNADEAALYGMLIGAGLTLLFWLMHGEAPPVWVTVVCTGVIMLPITIWSTREQLRESDKPRATKED